MGKLTRQHEGRHYIVPAFLYIIAYSYLSKILPFNPSPFSKLGIAVSIWS